MASERSIPHLRDIFGLNNYSNNSGSVQTPTAPSSCNNLRSDVDFTNGNVDSRKSSRKKRDNNKTLTSGDVKTLERHLSMKKTIRKKIMRDLQQAFVEDPNEFRIENNNQEQLKAELKAEAFRFGDNTKTRKSDNFLDMLRGDQKGVAAYDYNTANNAQSREYDYDSQVPVAANEKQSFWKRLTMKNKRR